MAESVIPTDLKEQIPESFPVGVIMQRSPARNNTWVDYIWEAVGISVGDRRPGDHSNPLLIHEENNVCRYLYQGFVVTQYLDECESYYHNLMSPNPSCYVIARTGDNDETPVPFLVSMSFDEAHAYLEGEAEIFSVPMPAELYRWSEAYVIANYVATQRKKRKRQDWKQQDQGARNV
jgi:hypothetical protein